MDSQVTENKTAAPVVEQPWKQNFKEMFGYGQQQQVDMKIIERGDTPPAPVGGVFKKVWDAYTPWRPKAAPQRTQGGRGNINNTGDPVDSVFDKLIHAESRGRHRTKDGGLLTSPVGAQGITQVMPASGKDPGYGVAPLRDDSEQEYVRFGKDLLRAYTKEFEGDIRKGLAAYNWGPGALKKAVSKHGDDWESKIPAETKKYLKNILGK